MSELSRIAVDPNQCGGRPCLRGRRIRVKDVRDLLAAGDITAALEYASRQSDPQALRTL